MLTQEQIIRLKHVRTIFSRLGDKWVLALNIQFVPEIHRFLLYGAKPELRALFFNWTHGKDICSYLDTEETFPPFTDDEFNAYFWYLNAYAEFLPKVRGRKASKHVARNRRYVMELPQRITMFRAMQAEEQHNIINAPDDVSLLLWLNKNRRLADSDQGRLQKLLNSETNRYHRWILSCLLGEADPDTPIDKEPIPEPDYTGTPLERLAQQCCNEYQLNRREFRSWVCRAVPRRVHYYFVEEFAILLLGMKKYQWDPNEEPDPEETMPLAAWQERAEEILGRPGSLEQLGRTELAAKIAAFICNAEKMTYENAAHLAEKEPDSVIRECFLDAVATRNSMDGRDEAVAKIRTRVTSQLCSMEEELRQGITFYSMLNEAETDERLLELIGSIPDHEFEQISPLNFAHQPLGVRVAYCYKRTRKYGILSLENLAYISDLKPEELENLPCNFFQLEPRRLLGMMLKFFCDGLDGSRMHSIFTDLFPIYLRSLATTAQLLTTSLAVWIDGTPAADVVSELEQCLLRNETPAQEWKAKNAYHDRWSLQELKCISFGGFRYPKGFMTIRRREIEARMKEVCRG